MIDERYILPILEDEINFHREEGDQPIFSLGVRIGLYRIGCWILGINTRGDAIADCLELFKWRMEMAIRLQDELTGGWYPLSPDDPHVTHMRDEHKDWEQASIDDLFDPVEYQDDGINDVIL